MGENTQQQQTQLSAELAAMVNSLKEMIEEPKKRKIEGKAYHPYYRLTEASALLPTLKAMYHDRKPRIIPRENFGVCTKRTAYQKLSYALLYLKREPHPDIKGDDLVRFIQSVMIREVSRGFVLESGRPPVDVFTAEIYEGGEYGTSVEWRMKLNIFIEEGEINKPFKLNNLSLTDEEISTLKFTLEQYPNLLFSVTKETINAVKLSPEDYARAVS